MFAAHPVEGLPGYAGYENRLNPAAEAAHDRSDLGSSLPLPIHHLREAAPQMPVVIDLREGEVFEGEKTEAAQPLFDTESSRLDRLKDRPYSLSFHGFPGLPDYSTGFSGPVSFLDNSQSLRLDCPPVLEPHD